MVQRTFTPRSQLQSVNLTEPGSNTALAVSTFEYDAGRRETSRTYGNGITTTRTYRADNLVSSITAPAVESLSYTYDVNKNPTSELRSGVMAPYSWATGESGFDAQNRLTNWTRQNGDSQSWQLTAVNDWQSFTNNGVPQQRTHGPTHEIQSIDTVPLQHDSRGNLTVDNRGTSMTYDADNMLSVFNANGVEGLRNATYTYDALGRRVSKTVAGATANDPSTTTLFILANQQVIAEYQSTGTQPPTLAARTAYGTYIDEPLILLSNITSQIAYYHTNRQYSVYALTDATGTVLDRLAYTPYGEHYCFTVVGTPRSHVSEAGNTTHFTGRSADAESGLHYFRARFFKPDIGRFLSHDPITYYDFENAYIGIFSISDTDPYGTIVVKVGDFDTDIDGKPTLLDDGLSGYEFHWTLKPRKRPSNALEYWQLTTSRITYKYRDCDEDSKTFPCKTLNATRYIIDVVRIGDFLNRDKQSLKPPKDKKEYGPLCHIKDSVEMLFGWDDGKTLILKKGAPNIISQELFPDSNPADKKLLDTIRGATGGGTLSYAYEMWRPEGCVCPCSDKGCDVPAGINGFTENLTLPWDSKPKGGPKKAK